MMLINLDKINAWSHWEYPWLDCGGVFHFSENARLSNCIEISRLIFNICQKWELCQFVPNSLDNQLKSKLEMEFIDFQQKKEGYKNTNFFKNFAKYQSSKFTFFDEDGHLSDVVNCTQLDNTAFKKFVEDNLVYFNETLFPYPDKKLIEVNYCYLDVNKIDGQISQLDNKKEIVNHNYLDVPIYLGLSQIYENNQVEKFRDADINWGFYLNINTDIFLQRVDRVSIYTKDYVDKCKIDNSILSRKNAPRLNSFLRDLEEVTRQFGGIWYYGNEPTELIKDGLINENRRIIIDGKVPYID